MVTIVFLLYPGICTRVFTTFKCQRIGEHLYFMADYSHLCYEGDHQIMVVLMYVCMGLFVLGIPIGSTLVLYFHRELHRVDDETASPELQVRGKRFETIYGALYDAYEPKYWWFESAIMINKALLTGGLVLVAPGSSVQILVGLVLALGFSVLLMQTKPYEEDDDDKLQTIATVSTVSTLLIGFALKVDRKAEEGEAGEFDTALLDIILIGLFVGVGVSGVYMILKSLPCFDRSSGDDDNNSSDGGDDKSSNDGGDENRKLENKADEEKKTVIVPVVKTRSSEKEKEDALTSSRLQSWNRLAGHTASQTVSQTASQTASQNASQKASQKASRARKVEQEVQQIRTNSELARRKTIHKFREQEKKADARVQKRLALRKRAKQTGALQKCVAFSKISDTSRDHIVDAMTYEKIACGTELCMQGHKADCMYLLMSGSCTVMVNMKEVGALSPLDVFGESALFASGDAQDPSRFRTATVIAVVDLEVLVLNKQELSRLIASGDLDKSTIAALAQLVQERKSMNTGGHRTPNI